MNSREIRTKFLHFFKNRGHEVVASSSLIPAEDPTLLFANAGMNQFKDMFLGKEVRSYTRATSIQKCMRAGGKHNDLEVVGFTKRHLTFFEMMGNFSFGDYFKKEAIAYAWDFLTNDMKLPKENLYATVFLEDDEAYAIWRDEIGLSEKRIFRLGAKDNFWQMGDTGPCGPCSEIYVDRGAAIGCGSADCAPGCSCDRFLEIWNLVFMQFDRQPDGTDRPLAAKGVDTGMGLERLSLVVQNKDSVFQIDIFSHLIAKIEQMTGILYKNQEGDRRAAFHVLADHIRAASFLIADGVSPSNDGRGYVLRKIIRRAALFAQKLTDKNIFPHLADAVVEDMGEFYPELKTNLSAIKNLLSSEIDKFALNLLKGQAILEDFFKVSAKDRQVNAQQLFKLYDTFGFPLELTKVIAHERGYTVDEVGFEQEMEKQRLQSGKKSAEAEVVVELPPTIQTTFTGYHETKTASFIIGLVRNGALVQKVPAHTQCWLIAQESPFYVERGGQVSDEGLLIIEEKEVPVTACTRFGEVIAVQIQTPSEIAVGDKVVSVVDRQKRLNTMKNHTATHLLQAALIEKFGKQIKQAGSLVAPDYLRFDFTYHQNLTADEIVAIENLVNEKIMDNREVTTTVTTHKDAIEKGSIAFFGDKYNAEKVRMVDVPGFSKELCGGTHVQRTGDIGSFKITEVTALSAGQRRMVAVTGPTAVALLQETFSAVKTIAQEFKVTPQEVVTAVEKQKQELQKLQSSLKNLKKEIWKSQLPAWLAQAELINSIPVCVIQVEDQHEQVRDIALALLQKKPGLYIVFSKVPGNCLFVAMISQDLQSKISMQALGQFLQETCGLRSGGKSNTLQGGGQEIPADSEQKIKAWLKEHMS